MSEQEFYYNQLTEPLKKHHAQNVLKHLDAIKSVYQFNIYLVDDTFSTVDKETLKLKFHANEDLAIDYCLDNRNENYERT